MRSVSLPESSKSNLSRFEDTRISIEGDAVLWKSRFTEYLPVLKKSVSTLFAFDATISLWTGSPILYP